METNKRNVVKVAAIGVNDLKTGSFILNQRRWVNPVEDSSDKFKVIKKITVVLAFEPR
jgi:hypothetical protein